MSRNGALFANQRLLAKNCTSFLLTPAHIIFTTSQHLIKFVHITKVEGDMNFGSLVEPGVFSLT
jgi:elongator complex protein 1